jgi:predicted metal-dependent phosphoesterase TrpH
VDVHSHTSASHDGRWRFDAERNRAWHRDAGFAAAYVTDHREYGGAEDGARGNPARAGSGTVLLPGIETRAGREHLNLLGARAADSLDRGGRLVVDRLRRLEARAGAARPLVVLTAPAFRPGGAAGSVAIDAIEVADGAPRGLAYSRVHRAEIGAAARKRGVALVAGSDLHGWGRTAAAWTVVRVPGWRALTPEQLDLAVRAALRHPESVRVVARTTVAPPVTLAAWLIAPVRVIWHLFAVAGAVERLAWLAWAWLLVVVGALVRRRGAARRGARAAEARRQLAAA